MALAIGWLVVALAASLIFVGSGSSQPVGMADSAPPPAATAVVVPSYQRGPRIIHVPQADERNERLSHRDARRDDRDVYENDDEEAAPPPRRHVAPPARTAPRWAPRREASPPPKPPRHIANTKSRANDAPVPQPPGPRRAVLSAPPPAAEGPTPIRPLPRLGAKAEGNEKFAAPREAAVTEGSPPPGYTPPLAAPHVEQPDDDAAK